MGKRDQSSALDRLAQKETNTNRKPDDLGQLRSRFEPPAQTGGSFESSLQKIPLTGRGASLSLRNAARRHTWLTESDILILTVAGCVMTLLSFVVMGVCLFTTKLEPPVVLTSGNSMVNNISLGSLHSGRFRPTKSSPGARQTRPLKLDSSSKTSFKYSSPKVPLPNPGSGSNKREESKSDRQSSNSERAKSRSSTSSSFYGTNLNNNNNNYNNNSHEDISISNRKNECHITPASRTSRGEARDDNSPVQPAGQEVSEMNPSGKKISAYQAGWNVTNAIQGMSLVSLPYAVLHGGYWGIVALVVCAHICCYTGKILVECLYERDPKTRQEVRVRHSYVDIARVCFGPAYGAPIVYVAQVIELLMTCILYVVLCGDLMIGSFPDGPMDMSSWMILCSITLIPCALLKDLKSVSVTSLWCTLMHLIINLIIFGYCFSKYQNWYLDRVKVWPDPETFPICLGIVVFSYTSQIFLPQLEGDMMEPGRFNSMLDWAHLIAAICKAAFAYVCFLTFGDATQEVITNNLPTHEFRGLVNSTLVIKALLSFPLPYYAAAHLIELSLFKGQPTSAESEPQGIGPQPFRSMRTRSGNYRSWAICLRIWLIVMILMAAISIPHFALLLGFIGSFTGTMLSFVWPCYFHMSLKWKQLNWFTVCLDCAIISMGMFFCLSGMYSSLHGLVLAIAEDHALISGHHLNHSSHHADHLAASTLDDFAKGTTLNDQLMTRLLINDTKLGQEINYNSTWQGP